MKARATTPLKHGGVIYPEGATLEVADEFYARMLADGVITPLAADAESDTAADTEADAEAADAESEAKPVVDSAGTVFDETRHMRFAKGERAGQPIINNDGTWRNKPGTGSV